MEKYAVKKIIHTTLEESYYKKLLEYGKGQINTGIETIIQLIEKKEITVNIKTSLTLTNHVEPIRKSRIRY